MADHTPPPSQHNTPSRPAPAPGPAHAPMSPTRSTTTGSIPAFTSRMTPEPQAGDAGRVLGATDDSSDEESKARGESDVSGFEAPERGAGIGDGEDEDDLAAYGDAPGVDFLGDSDAEGGDDADEGTDGEEEEAHNGKGDGGVVKHAGDFGGDDVMALDEPHIPSETSGAGAGGGSQSTPSKGKRGKGKARTGGGGGNAGSSARPKRGAAGAGHGPGQGHGQGQGQQGQGSQGGGQGKGAKKDDLLDAQIVSGWNHDFGDVCKIKPASSTGVKA